MNTGITFLLTAIMAFAASVVATGDAVADDASCIVFEIRASNGSGGVDPSLAPLANKLKKPPFSAWKEFKVVKRHSASITQKKSKTFALSIGGTLGLLYKERTDGQGKKPRLRLGISVDDTGGKRIADTTLSADSGGYNLIGSGGKDGTANFLAIGCTVQ